DWSSDVCSSDLQLWKVAGLDTDISVRGENVAENDRQSDQPNNSSLQQIEVDERQQRTDTRDKQVDRLTSVAIRKEAPSKGREHSHHCSEQLDIRDGRPGEELVSAREK